MRPVKFEVSVDTSSLRLEGEYLRGRLQFKLGKELLPAKAEEEFAALVLCGLMQVSQAILNDETERAPVVLEGSLFALLLENGGRGKLDVMAFELAPKGGDSKQIGFWHVKAREFIKALLHGADAVVRASIINEWDSDDVSALIHLSIVCKQWLDDSEPPDDAASMGA